MFHRIYESMGLGMHPASLYPRRNRIAPAGEGTGRARSRDQTLHSTRVGEGSQLSVPIGVVGPERLDVGVPAPHNSGSAPIIAMPFDEDLRRQFEALTDRIRAEVTRQLALATDELTASVDAERVGAVLQAATDARAEAEQEASARLRTAVAEAQERGRSEGWDAARQDGVAQGRLEGRAEGRAEALAEGRAEGKAEILHDGR